jgi:hypothetical protein
MRLKRRGNWILAFYKCNWEPLQMEFLRSDPLTNEREEILKSRRHRTPISVWNADVYVNAYI